MVQCPEFGSPTQRLRPDIRLEHQDPVSHTAEKKREENKIIIFLNYYKK